MAHQQKLGLTILAVASMHSATDAFVPLENHAKKAVSTFDQMRSRRGYSNNNNIDDNNNNNNFVAPGPIDPKSSSSDPIEFVFNDESFLKDIESSPIGFNSESTLPNQSENVDASAILAENAAILASGKGDTFDLGFDLNLDSTVEPATNASEGALINQDLQAVLAASGEAAAEAEASMSQELVDHLDELAVAALNATNLVTTSNDEVDAPPPEVVPTIATIAPQQEQQAPPTPMLSNVEELSLAPGTDISESTNTSTDSNTLAESTPSVRKILKFAIPAIGVWLCGPILSLIDTSAVGVLSGTVQQAALNPAVAVTDYAALLIAFLYTGTTNMVASAQQSDRGTSGMPRTAKMMIGAMRMSTYVGAGLGAFLFVFARPLLAGIIGNDSISPAVFAAAMKYVRIRALGMPAAAILGSTQAACLGMQDIKSPLYVLGAAAVINLLGDMLFVGHSNPLIGGTAGAAWATVLSQYAAVAFFIRWLCDKTAKTTAEKQPDVMNLSDAIMEMTSRSDDNNVNGKNRRKSFRNVMDTFKRKSESMKRKRSSLGKNKTSPKTNNDDSFSTRGFLKSRFSTIDLLKLPDQETREKFAPYVLPVTSTQVGRVSGYVAMAHVVASSLGTVSMAAQQVIVSIFYCLCPIADSLSLTAQSFVPAIADKEDSMEKSAAMKKTLVNFLKAGGVFGGAMMAAVCGIPMMAGWFTPDQGVINLVNSVVPLLLVFFGVHGFVCGTEGILLGQKDLGFLGKMYAAFFAAVPYIMLGVKKKALAGCKSVGLSSVWTVFIGYQLARCALWLSRSVLLQRRTYMAAKKATSPVTTTTTMSDLLAP